MLTLKPPLNNMMKWLFRVLLLLWLLLAGPMIMLIFGPLDLEGDWSTTNRRSAQLAPLPARYPDAVVQVYAARTWSWRGAFSIHTWIATKRSQAQAYTVYQVIGWHQYQHQSNVIIEYDTPDRYWFGQQPYLLLDLRGQTQIEALITQIETAVAYYPYQNHYRIWPGPNSNTFTAFIARAVPELGLELPPTAIGKDFLSPGQFLMTAPSGQGVQLSFYGLFGMMIGLEEGIEFNILTLNLGIDPLGLAIKLPGIGRVGF